MFSPNAIWAHPQWMSPNKQTNMDVQDFTTRNGRNFNAPFNIRSHSETLELTIYGGFSFYICT